MLGGRASDSIGSIAVDHTDSDIVYAASGITPADDIVSIEINPRFGGGVPLSIAVGADSPRWILELLLGRQLEI